MLRYHFGDGIINCHVEINKAAQWTVSNFSMIRPGINTATSATVITCVKIVLQKFVILRYNTVADPGFSKWGGAVLSQMGGAHPVFR